MALLEKPLRDTSANSPGDILRRLAFVAYLLLAVAGLGLIVAAVAQQDARFLAAAGGALIAFLALHCTRRIWLTAAGPRVQALFSSRPAPVHPHAASTTQPAGAPPTPVTRSGRRPCIVILNAALGGDTGNTAQLLRRVRDLLAPSADLVTVTLAESNVFESLRQTLAAADGFVIGTGTHWDSWSSVLQKFLEDATEVEGTAVWLGKPVACVVTEHSVGGKGVLSRLQGVLVTLGCMLPPMSGLVISRAAHVAARHEAAAARDFWCSDDLDVVCHNLLEALQGTGHWRTWPVDRSDFRARWLES